MLGVLAAGYNGPLILEAACSLGILRKASRASEQQGVVLMQ